MTTFSGHGCSALSTICDSSRNASSATRARCGRRNDSIHGSRAGRSIRSTRPARRATCGLGRRAAGGTEGRCNLLHVQDDQPVATRVGHIEPAALRRIGDARRRAERVTPAVADLADDAVRSDGAHVAVVVVRDEDRHPPVRLGHHGNAGRTGQRGLGRRTVVAGVPPAAVAGDGRDVCASSRRHAALADGACRRCTRRRSARSRRRSAC